MTLPTGPVTVLIDGKTYRAESVEMRWPRQTPMSDEQQKKSAEDFGRLDAVVTFTFEGTWDGESDKQA